MLPAPGSRPGDKTLNIFEALRESHDRQRGYADALIQTSGDSAERAEAYKQLKDELQAHETAEERFFYIPLMAHDNGVDLSRHAISEHHEMDEMMEELDETEMSSPAWLATAKKLSEKVHHHLKEEEQKFFQMAGKLLDDKQKESLAGEYVKEYEEQLAES
ncbi:hemerythrin domain-containing protein [Pseudomonas syringae]|uniref:Hemerythrin domain-containing protein n=3 Tax=Pseudomonas syringae TaxID=317 RepID=A0A9Q4FH19_PSESX|nr:hemerythrin domain-containing protein [Pseudomonas syringae]MCF5471339.1 hemerythrin domain-containing protein [Pseudomonas syringae]MCF5482366.1 hemerythrin domain-containing protein [Pseudomonas syringae]MCF5486248.1 hemerythrin domain-containing protein [Pseudomonas syringae]MCF5493282.1 hemerythrin domain-containing protein [Pseudomonas syringae]